MSLVPLRVTLRRLSVFAGPFDVEATRAVAGHDDPDGAATLERLLELVNKSLVSAYRTADQACYLAKDNGRNCVVATEIDSRKMSIMRAR